MIHYRFDNVSKHINEKYANKVCDVHKEQKKDNFRMDKKKHEVIMKLAAEGMKDEIKVLCFIQIRTAGSDLACN